MNILLLLLSVWLVDASPAAPQLFERQASSVTCSKVTAKCKAAATSYCASYRSIAQSTVTSTVSNKKVKTITTTANTGTTTTVSSDSCPGANAATKAKRTAGTQVPACLSKYPSGTALSSACACMSFPETTTVTSTTAKSTTTVTTTSTSTATRVLIPQATCSQLRVSGISGGSQRQFKEYYSGCGWTRNDAYNLGQKSYSASAYSACDAAQACGNMAGSSSDYSFSIEYRVSTDTWNCKYFGDGDNYSVESYNYYDPDVKQVYAWNN